MYGSKVTKSNLFHLKLKNEAAISNFSVTITQIYVLTKYFKTENTKTPNIGYWILSKGTIVKFYRTIRLKLFICFRVLNDLAYFALFFQVLKIHVQFRPVYSRLRFVGNRISWVLFWK